MEKVEIKDKEKTEAGWSFFVEIGEGKDNTGHFVSLDKDYWKKITERRHKPEELVEKSFEFLLQREPKESILEKFNLQVISDYFPEYEQEIRKLLR